MKLVGPDDRAVRADWAADHSVTESGQAVNFRTLEP